MGFEVPEELKGLALYAADEKLCAKWPELFPCWRAAYPGVDIMQEVRKAHAWELCNPERRKVRKDRFLNNWLSKAQDSGQWQRGAANRPATPMVFRKTQCANCGGTGKVAVGVDHGIIALGPCGRCQRREDVM